MSADEGRGRARLTFDRLDDLPFRAADVGYENVGRRSDGGAKDILGNAIHRCARQSRDQLPKRPSSRSVVPRSIAPHERPGRGGADLDRYPTTCAAIRRDAERQPDGTADQPDTDDDRGSETLQRMTLCVARRTSSLKLLLLRQPDLPANGQGCHGGFGEKEGGGLPGGVLSIDPAGNSWAWSSIVNGVSEAQEKSESVEVAR